MSVAGSTTEFKYTAHNTASHTKARSYHVEINLLSCDLTKIILEKPELYYTGMLCVDLDLNVNTCTNQSV